MKNVKKVKSVKRKTIAIPFLITILISLILIGIPVMKFYEKVVEKDKIKNFEIKEEDEYKAKPEDDATILFILDTNDTSDKNTYLLLRTLVDKKQFVVVTLANDTIVDYKNNKSTVDNLYYNGGVPAIKTAISESLNIEIDKYIKLNDESFIKICDILGGVTYYIPEGIKNFNVGMQYLSSEKIMTFLSYKNMQEDQRVFAVNGLVSEMLKQTIGERLAEILKDSFFKLIDIMETDISSIDFNNGKDAVAHVFKNDDYNVYFREVKGERDVNGFNVDNDFIYELQILFGYEED